MKKNKVDTCTFVEFTAINSSKHQRKNAQNPHKLTQVHVHREHRITTMKSIVIQNLNFVWILYSSFGWMDLIGRSTVTFSLFQKIHTQCLAKRPRKASEKIFEYTTDTDSVGMKFFV